MTYLQLVNNVLLRLRERQVGTVNENAYSQLIGKFVNDSNQEIEQTWDWSGLRTTLSATTTAGVFSYELNNAGTSTEILNVINDTTDNFLRYGSSSDFDRWYLNPISGEPQYYTWNGISNDNDIQVDIYPKPDSAYTLRFNIIKRGIELSNDTDATLAPSKAIELLAYAKAVEERGEDGGQSAQGAYRTAERALSDAIAIDGARHPEELIYAPV
jgi:hypothetical protein